MVGIFRPSFYPRPKGRIGILGGSFNPAHEGHIHISKTAYAQLGLDAVWWLVSPQNPLKSTDGMESLGARVRQAQTITASLPFIKITDIEQVWGKATTFHTLRRLQRHFPDIEFIWLMGDDNLASFHHWYRWRDIARMVEIAVVKRNPDPLYALNSPAMRHIGAGILYLNTKIMPHSATEIRKKASILSNNNVY